MMPDFLLEETIDFKFTTRAFATGVPTTLAGTPAVEIYEDNSITQITAAETLTVDFDGVTGLHNLRIVATAANGFEAGKSYSAVVSAGTVGGVSVVGETIFNFSIEKSAAFKALSTHDTAIKALLPAARELARLRLGLVSEREAQQIELLRRRGKKEIALVALHVARAVKRPAAARQRP